MQDDGVGLDPATLPSRLHDGHIGLLSVIERVEGARGSVVFAVASGGGLIVTARVPRVVNEPVGKMSV